MRLIVLISFISFVVNEALAQSFFPVKLNKKWGLIDEQGSIVIDPVYDAIGEFKRFGYAVIQRNGVVGLLNRRGEQLIRPQYEDLKVLDSTLVTVLDQDEWMVINLDGAIILQKGYQKVNVWDGRFLSYMKDNVWGIADIHGRVICEPAYEELEWFENDYFKTQMGKNYGLLSIDGKTILKPECKDIKVHNENLFFFLKEKSWGAVDRNGAVLINTVFDRYEVVSQNFIKLYRDKNLLLYSVLDQRIITQGEYDNYYSFSDNYVLSKRNRQLGLLNIKGELVLDTKYDEVQYYFENQFRVNSKGKWGVVTINDQVITPFEYDYIAPLNKSVSIVKIGNRFGVVNLKGERIIPVEFDRIELSKDQEARAYKGEALSLFYYDENGNLKDKSNFKKHLTFTVGKKKRMDNFQFVEDAGNDLLLDNFEWFYSPRADRWGLRKLIDGSIQIEPQFDEINVQKGYGMTIVGIEKFSYFDFEKTSFRFEMAYGIVNNEQGLLVSDIDMLDIRLTDFDRGYPTARVIFIDGLHGLVNRSPVGLINKKDFAFIGDFKDGVARMSTKGRLSGSFKNKSKGLEPLSNYLNQIIAPYYMVDYTRYDSEFETDAVLTCEKCEWGYIDTAGQILIQPQYSFARDFVNEVGIIELNGKWGLTDRASKVLIPCQYDELDFLENSNNQILQVSNFDKKYGLIDTLGQVRVNLAYDQIGAFSDGRLAVKRNGLWGFVDEEGNEVIPCKYTRVNDFNEGLASVKYKQRWGFIDKNGKTHIDFIYRRMGNFQGGLAWVMSIDGLFYLDTDGNPMITGNFTKAFDFEGDVARVVVDGKYGLIDNTGAFIVKPRYTFINAFDENNLAIVRAGGNKLRTGVIDKSGRSVAKVIYKNILPFREGMAVVKTKNGYGFIDLNGDLVISDIYSKAGSFSQGRAMVQQEGLCGYINKAGEEIIKLEYSKCLDFSEGKAIVYKGYKKGGVVDLEGNYIIEPSVNRLIDFSDDRGLVRDNRYRFFYVDPNAKIYDGYYQNAGKFQHGVAVVQMNGDWGVINQKGMELIAPKYDKIEEFIDGYAIVRIKSFSGLSTLAGEVIIEPEFEYISYAGEGVFRVEKGDKIGYFNAAGEWIWDLKE